MPAIKIGDLVIHRKTLRRYTVAHVGGGPLVRVSWIGRDALGEPLECTTTFLWDELRSPTPAELAGKESSPAAAGDVSNSSSGDVSPADPGDGQVAFAATEPPPANGPGSGAKRRRQ